MHTSSGWTLWLLQAAGCDLLSTKGFQQEGHQASGGRPSLGQGRFLAMATPRFSGTFACPRDYKVQGSFPRRPIFTCRPRAVKTKAACSYTCRRLGSAHPHGRRGPRTCRAFLLMI